MAKRKNPRRRPRATRNYQRRHHQGALDSRVSRSGGDGIMRMRKVLAKAKHKTKPSKPKFTTGRTKTPTKIVRGKLHKKIVRKKQTATRARKKSTIDRVKSALTRIKRRGHWVVKRQSSRPARPGAKGKHPKARTITKRRKRGHASIRFFSDGKAVKANVSRTTAGIIGTYLASVRRLLDMNDAEPLEQLAGKSVKDVRGNVFPLETRPNVLYRLNVAVEPLEEIYRLLA